MKMMVGANTRTRSHLRSGVWSSCSSSWAVWTVQLCCFFLKRATLNGLWKWDHGQGSFTRCSWRRLRFFFFLTHWFSKGWMWLGQWVRGRREARDSNRRCDAADPFPPSADVQDWSDSLLLSFIPCLRWSSAPVFRYEPAAGWIRPHWKVSTQGQ